MIIKTNIYTEGEPIQIENTKLKIKRQWALIVTVRNSQPDQKLIHALLSDGRMMQIFTDDSDWFLETIKSTMEFNVDKLKLGTIIKFQDTVQSEPRYGILRHAHDCFLSLVTLDITSNEVHTIIYDIDKCQAGCLCEILSES